MPHPYRLDPPSTAITALAAGIAREVAAAYAASVDAEGRFPAESIAALSDQGLMGLCVPEALGGRGLGMRAFAAVAEELGGACASTAMVYVMHTAATQTIAASRTLAGRDELLSDIARGRHLTTLAATEAGSRSNFWFQVSELRSEGDDCLLTTTKRFVTSSGHADSYVGQARRPGATGPADLTMFLLRRSGPGVRVRGGFDGLGLRGNESAPIDFIDYRVPVGDLMSPHGEGNPLSLSVVLPWFNVGTAAMAHGLCRAAVGMTAAHLQSTTLEHDGSRLRDLPTLRARLADMAVRTEQSRALLGHTLDQIEEPSDVTPLYVLQARLAAINAAVEVTDRAMKACGGAAFSKQLGIERLFRDARAGWVMAPTSDALSDFVGRALTGLDPL